MQYPFFVCPLEDYAEDNTNCTVPSSFLLRYPLISLLQVLLASEMMVNRPFSWGFALLGRKASVYVYPFLGHTVIMALFASLLGPFGGFFASGFKRAFKIKVLFLPRTVDLCRTSAT